MDADLLEEPQTTQQCNSLIDLVRDWFEKTNKISRELHKIKGYLEVPNDYARECSARRVEELLKLVEKLEGEQDLWLASVE